MRNKSVWSIRKTRELLREVLGELKGSGEIVSFGSIRWGTFEERIVNVDIRVLTDTYVSPTKLRRIFHILEVNVDVVAGVIIIPNIIWEPAP